MELDWQEEAACRGTDPELWFGFIDETEQYTVAVEQYAARKRLTLLPALALPTSELYRIEQARAICEGCPVAEQCLHYAVTHPEPYGIWGGTTGAERRVSRTDRIVIQPRHMVR